MRVFVLGILVLLGVLGGCDQQALVRHFVDGKIKAGAEVESYTLGVKAYTWGLTATEMIDGALSGAVRGLFVVGENPMISEPNQNHTRKALEQAEFLVCQDIFINETGEMADVILPATSFAEKDGTFTNSDRRVQRVRKAINPPGQARADWQIICDLATRIEKELNQPTAGWTYSHPSEIWEEMRQLTPDFGGIDYDRLEREGGVHSM